ncbi:MAG: hypothetical protein B9S32_05945 [Verrucomicrobia bacterium Tous-C9LFEB]|nr:MAG: hypothetical protein B9S32_05945 [Verrucomicrobia bacterium Tous-C9LFEB]
MKKIILVLCSLILSLSSSFAQEKPGVWQNPPSTTVSEEGIRLKYLESVLGVNRTGWSCRVPKGYTATFRLYQAGDPKSNIALVYEGSKMTQSVVSDLFVASTPDPTSKEHQILSFGSSQSITSFYLQKKGGVRIHFPDVKTGAKSTLFEVFAPTNRETPQIWCDVEFIKTP